MKLRSVIIPCLILTSVSSIAWCGKGKRATEDPVPRLIKLLQSEDANARRWALFGLRQIGDRRGYRPTLELLYDDNERTREQAIRTAARLGGKKAIDAILQASDCNSNRDKKYDLDKARYATDPLPDDPLTAILTDLDMPQRSVIADVLAEIGDVRAVRPLVAMHPGRHITHALAAFGPKAANSIMAFLEQTDSATRVTAADALRLMRYKPAIPKLRNALDTQDKDVREAAASAICAMGDPSGIPILRGMLSDTKVDGVTRGRAACSLGRFGGKSVAADLVKMLSEPNHEVVVGAACGLGLLSDPANIEPLLAMSKVAYGQEAMAADYALLSIARGMSVQELLSRYMEPDDFFNYVEQEVTSNRRELKDVEAEISNPDPKVREVAMEAYWRKGVPQDKAVEWTKSSIPRMRELATCCVGLIPAEALAALLDDPEASVRESAIYALAAAGDKRALPYLAKRLEAGSDSDRLYAFECLRQMPDELVSDIMAQYLSDTNTVIREGSLRTLITVKDKRAHIRLLEMLKSTDPSEQQYAARALIEMGDFSGVDVLQPLLESKNEQEKLDNALILSVTGDKRALEALLELSRHPVWGASDRLISGLAKYDDPRVTTVLLGALRCNYIPAAEAADEALGKKRVTEAFGPIVEAAKAGHIGPSDAISSLCAIDHKRATDLRIDMVGNPDADISMRSASFRTLLTETKQPRVVAALTAVAGDLDPSDKSLVINELEDRKDPRCDGLLVKFISDSDPDTRWNAAWILSLLRTPGARKAIIEKVVNWDMDVLAGSIEYVIGLGDERTIPQLTLVFAAHPDQADRFVGPLIHSREPRLVRAAKAYCATHSGTSMDEEPTNRGAALCRWGELRVRR